MLHCAVGTEVGPSIGAIKPEYKLDLGFLEHLRLSPRVVVDPGARFREFFFTGPHADHRTRRGPTPIRAYPHQALIRPPCRRRTITVPQFHASRVGGNAGGELRSNGRQRSPPPWHTAGAEARAHDDLGRIHSGSSCGVDRHRFLRGGGPHVARPGDLLRAILFDIAGITDHPTEQWMQQMAQNATMEGCGALGDRRYLIHDRDTKYTASFLAIIESGQSLSRCT
jgi:hypothetical protein